MHSHPAALASAHWKRPLIWLGACVAVAGLVLAFGEISDAEPTTAPHLVYLSINGDGPSAKAWYDGSAPTGVPVQTALDTFSRQGYQLGEVSEARQRGDGETNFVWMIILERPGR